MLSFIVIASLVLPSVLGGCCFPDRLSAIGYRAGDPNSYNFTVDFKINKYFLKPSAGPVDYILSDMNNGNDYFMYKDGKCSYAKSTFEMRQCIPDNARDFEFGEAVFAGVNVHPYLIPKDDGRSIIVTTHEGCIPVMIIRVIGDVTSTIVYTNVTTSVPDVSVLNTNVDNCQARPSKV